MGAACTSSRKMKLKTVGILISNRKTSNGSNGFDEAELARVFKLLTSNGLCPVSITLDGGKVLTGKLNCSKDDPYIQSMIKGNPWCTQFLDSMSAKQAVVNELALDGLFLFGGFAAVDDFFRSVDVKVLVGRHFDNNAVIAAFREGVAGILTAVDSLNQCIVRNKRVVVAADDVKDVERINSLLSRKEIKGIPAECGQNDGFIQHKNLITAKKASKELLIASGLVIVKEEKR
eukprot:jgi/Bigna1/89183/estExt_fgenesh1_pg.C_450037